MKIPLLITTCLSTVMLVSAPVIAAEASTTHSTQSNGESAMPDQATIVDLFNRWQQVWEHGNYDLIPSCIGPTYIRHDGTGEKEVTREDYTKTIKQAREQRPDTRFVIYDHSIKGDRAWFRFTLKWKDPKTGETHTQAGMQLYRIEDGKLAETWLTMLKPGTAWSDTVAQKTWTSAPPRQGD